MQEAIGDIYANFRAYDLSLLFVMIMFCTTFPVAGYLGYRAGERAFIRRSKDPIKSKKAPGETTLGAILALLGLLLAFTYAFALSRSDNRKSTMVEEAAAVSTAFLRADLLDEPGRTELREALLEYARTRYVETTGERLTQEDIDAILARTIDAQERLWPLMMQASASVSPPAQTFIASGITDVLDAHTRRIAAMSENIPEIVKVLLAVVSTTAIAIVGHNSALHGRLLTWRTPAFALMLALLLVVILDMERPGEGLILLNEDAMRAAIYDMEAMLAAEQ